MNGITHIFFDLDHTLWDYDTNARETLTEIYNDYNLGQYYTTAEAFINSFHYTNSKLWKRYNVGEIDRDYIRENRFKSLFKDRGGISDEVNSSISSYFFNTCPMKTALVSGTWDVLESLKNRYELGIITNGFEDTQNIKLTNAGIKKYFKYIITSETAGYRKPSLEIFELALSKSGVTAEEVVMIGDNYSTDIAGAKNAGWKSFWFNPENKTNNSHDLQIKDLTELLQHL